MQQRKENFVIKEKGRSQDEEAFVLVQNDIYQGYGFIEKNAEIAYSNDLSPFLIRNKNTVEARGIIRSYINKNPDKIIGANSEYYVVP